GIKVELWRSSSEKVTQRAISEARARRFSVDAVETIGTDLERMTREKIFAEFHSPHLADLIPAAIPRHRAWFPDRLSYLGVAYNTKLVRREDLPGTYEGFLDPKWRGKLGIEASDIAWLAGIVKFWGEDRGMRFFERLAVMKPDVRTGHTLLTQLVAAGEVPVGLTVYSSGVVPHKRTGAPIDWEPIEPVIGQPLGIGLAKNGGAALRRLRPVARRPGALQFARPSARELEGEDRPEQLRLHHDGPRRRAGRKREVGKDLERPVSEQMKVGVRYGPHRS
ncbi:MAG: hypothetical protein E6H75_14975, partial [Betaproteobacteria bacterium]